MVISAQNGPKMNFFDNFSKLDHYFLLEVA